MFYKSGFWLTMWLTLVRLCLKSALNFSSWESCYHLRWAVKNSASLCPRASESLWYIVGFVTSSSGWWFNVPRGWAPSFQTEARISAPRADQMTHRRKAVSPCQRRSKTVGINYPNFRPSLLSLTKSPLQYFFTTYEPWQDSPCFVCVRSHEYAYVLSVCVFMYLDLD